MAATTLLVGCGRLGGAILKGWRATGAVAMPDLAIQSPSSRPVIEAAVSDGAVWNSDSLEAIERVVLAVKPARWREVAASLAPRLPQHSVIFSVMAGVRAEAMASAFAGHPIVRVMPTTAVSSGQGVATLWSADARDAARARELFDPISEVVQVDREDLIDVATAVSGSGAAYAYAFVRALARAGEAAGLTPEQAGILALKTCQGAVARLEEGEAADALIAEVASPGGTTQAGLAVLEPALTSLIEETVQAALKRSRELAAQ